MSFQSPFGRALLSPFGRVFDNSSPGNGGGPSTPDPNLLFQTHFPDATSVEDGTSNDHVITLFGGAVVDTAQPLWGQAGSVNCTGATRELQIADSPQFSRESGVFTYEFMFYPTVIPTNTRDVFAHWKNSTNRSLALQIPAFSLVYLYYSENGSSFEFTSHSFALTPNAYNHAVIWRGDDGKLRLGLNGTVEGNLTMLTNSFFDSSEPIKILGGGDSDDGIFAHLGWAALRNDNVYGDIGLGGNYTVPTAIYPLNI